MLDFAKVISFVPTAFLDGINLTLYSCILAAFDIACLVPFSAQPLDKTFCKKSQRKRKNSPEESLENCRVGGVQFSKRMNNSRNVFVVNALAPTISIILFV